MERRALGHLKKGIEMDDHLQGVWRRCKIRKISRISFSPKMLFVEKQADLYQETNFSCLQCVSRYVKFCHKRCAHLNQGKDAAEESEDLTSNFSSLLHLHSSCVSWTSHPTSLCLSDPICQMGGWVGHLRILLPYDVALPHFLGCGGKWSFTTGALQHHRRRGFAHKLSTRLTWPLFSRDAENQGNQKIFIL